MEPKLIILYFFLIVILFSGYDCDSSQNGHKDEMEFNREYLSYPKIDLRKFINTKNRLKNLSSIAEDIGYIKLETTDEAIIGNPGHIIPYDDKLVISDNTGTVFIFRKDGRFIRKFNRKGRGPGEYIGIYDIDVDRENGHIWIDDFMGGKIIVVDLSGNVVRVIKPPSRPEGLEYLRDGYFCVLLNVNGFKNINERLSTVIVDSTGKIIVKHKYSLADTPLNRPRITSTGCVHGNKAGVEVNEAFNDTVYLITPDFKKVPELILESGKMKQHRSDIEGLFTSEKKLIGNAGANKINNFVSVTFQYDNMGYSGIYDLKTKNYFLIKKGDEFSGLRDDMDSGPPLYVFRLHGEVMYNVIFPMTFDIDTIPPESGFYKIAHSLSPDDNGVIRVIKMRENILVNDND